MESSISLEIGALGKPTRPSERLRDDDGESFGKSRQTYAFERKIMLRKRAKAIRERSRATITILPRKEEGYQVFEPLSDDARELGIRSYKIEAADTSNTMSGPVRQMGRILSISLPYVSILGASA